MGRGCQRINQRNGEDAELFSVTALAPEVSGVLSVVIAQKDFCVTEAPGPAGGGGAGRGEPPGRGQGGGGRIRMTPVFTQDREGSSRHSQTEGVAERSVDSLHVGFRYGTEPPVNHCPLYGSQDPSHHGRKKQSGSLPLGEEMVAKETLLGIAGDGGHNDFLTGTVIGRGANNDSRAEFLS